MAYDKFEVSATGRGSKAHKDYLKKEIKQNLNILKLKDMSLKELNDRADELLDRLKKDSSILDDIREELTALQEYLDAHIKTSKHKEI